jgi:hypothetical protein
MKSLMILLVLLSPVVLGYSIINADALSFPPQHIRTWEWNSTSSLGLVTTTSKNVTLTQTTFSDQPGRFPTQAILVRNDGAIGAPDIFFTATADSSVNTTNTSTSNNVTNIRIIAGDPPIAIDGRFNYFSIIRGTNGTNADTSARLDAIY